MHGLIWPIKAYIWHRLAAWYLNLLESNPYTTKGFTTGIVKALSDVTGQLTVDGRVGNYRSAYIVFGILVDATGICLTNI